MSVSRKVLRRVKKAMGVGAIPVLAACSSQISRANGEVRATFDYFTGTLRFSGDGVGVIDDSWKECYKPQLVKSITIGKGIKEIGYCAFDGCSFLEEINISSSVVTTIGGHAFSGCKSLEKINIPGPVTEIGRRAFEYCESLKEINIPNSVTSIGTGAFCHCKSLEEINIPISVTTVGYDTFKNCFGLKTVRFGYGDNSRKHLRALDFFLHNKNNKKKVVSKVRKGFYGNLKPYLEEFLFRDEIIIKKNAFTNCKSLKYLDTDGLVLNCEEGAFCGTPLFQNFGGKVICEKYHFPYHQDMVAKALLLDSINDRFNKNGEEENPVDCPLRYPPFGHSSYLLFRDIAQ